MDKINFFVKRNIILSFKNSGIIIERFIKNRLDFFFPNNSIFFIEGSDQMIATSGIVVEISSINPFQDCALIKTMIDALQQGQVVVSDGHIPGTAPDKIYYAGETKSEKKIITSDKQSRYNTQFGIYKLKRLKLFQWFIANLDALHTWSLEDFLHYVESEAGVEAILKYGEDVSLDVITECPYCASPDQKKLFHQASHPLNGFLTKNVSYYSQCNACDLVYMKAMFKKQDVPKIYDDYNNEFALHALESRTLHEFSPYHMFQFSTEYVANSLSNPSRIVDLGCGGGEFIVNAKKVFKDSECYGVDYVFSKEDRQLLIDGGVEPIQGDFVQAMANLPGTFDLITAWEVIEHIYIDELEKLMKAIMEKLSKKGYFVFSTPDFDNPLCKLYDFWAACPVQHLSVFSESWLRKFLAKFDCKIVKQFHGCAPFRTAGWARYWAATAGSENDRANAVLLTSILEDEKLKNNLLENLLKNNLGSEIVLVIQKN